MHSQNGFENLNWLVSLINVYLPDQIINDDSFEKAKRCLHVLVVGVLVNDSLLCLSDKQQHNSTWSPLGQATTKILRSNGGMDRLDGVDTAHGSPMGRSWPSG